MIGKINTNVFIIPSGEIMSDKANQVEQFQLIKGAFVRKLVNWNNHFMWWRESMREKLSHETTILPSVQSLYEKTKSVEIDEQ